MEKKPTDALAQAMKTNDPRPLTSLDVAELEKLKLAEDILEARYQAEKRANRISNWGAMLVGYVALAGFFANAYQSYMNKKHLDDQQKEEKDRWTKEFDRSRRSDKYRAFFETSALVTDQQSDERRLVGFALMDEFVADPDYHQKAMSILDQSLARELSQSAKEPPVAGLSEGHRAAISEIVKAMSASSSCRELQHAAESIGRVVDHAKYADPDENRELFSLYTRRLVGRAAVICKSEADFRLVRNPIRNAMLGVGQIENLGKGSTKPDAARGVADLLISTCQQELSEYISRDCVDIRTHYQAICKEMHKDPAKWKHEEAACSLVSDWPPPPPDDTPQVAATQPE